MDCPPKITRARRYAGARRPFPFFALALRVLERSRPEFHIALSLAPAACGRMPPRPVVVGDAPGWHAGHFDTVLDHPELFSGR